MGRELGQLETGRTDADYGEPDMTAEDANDAIAKAEHIVDVVAQALEGGPSVEADEGGK